ncbi:phage GP46 family protein [Methylobacterium sp. E-066]|uniref:phage GP46 family protein n=1 Tax=Methylobacterium sp. E-066 TaxID=2836584 RepID=UPI001FBA0736|nr:phage GP46 family protein [Methylobacterium sp. E-066]MCJ2143745.1 phage GP46 family protein [Methylobacterium sp. E-066]
MQLTLTPLADAGVSLLPFDIVWNGIVGDFAVSTGGDDGPAGGLVSANPLRTAVLLLLFTDARADAASLRFDHRGDRRGWPGDGFDIDAAAGEAPLGSLLWLFRRSALLDATGAQIEAEVQRALKPLIRQGAAARITTSAVVDKANGRVALSVGLYGRDGSQSYSDKFDILWRRADGGL